MEVSVSCVGCLQAADWSESEWEWEWEVRECDNAAN